MFRAAVLAVALLALLAGAAPAQDAPDEIVERIRELRREIDELLARLPPELREEVRRSLAEPPPPAVPEASAAAPAAPVSPPPPPSPPSPPPPRRPRTACNTLTAFDTDGDGKVDARDRYWRYLYLWLDRNGNGRMEEREIVSPFDRKVREIATDLDGFAGAKGLYGEIRRGDYLVLDLRGDGFDGKDDGVLLVDAGALARGDGPRLLSAEGEEIAGVQPFQRGWRLRDADGTVTRLTCP